MVPGAIPEVGAPPPLTSVESGSDPLVAPGEGETTAPGLCAIEVAISSWQGWPDEALTASLNCGPVDESVIPDNCQFALPPAPFCIRQSLKALSLVRAA